MLLALFSLLDVDSTFFTTSSSMQMSEKYMRKLEWFMVDDCSRTVSDGAEMWLSNRPRGFVTPRDSTNQITLSMLAVFLQT